MEWSYRSNGDGESLEIRTRTGWRSLSWRRGEDAEIRDRISARIQWLQARPGWACTSNLTVPGWGTVAKSGVA